MASKIGPQTKVKRTKTEVWGNWIQNGYKQKQWLNNCDGISRTQTHTVVWKTCHVTVLSNCGAFHWKCQWIARNWSAIGVCVFWQFSDEKIHKKSSETIKCAVSKLKKISRSKFSFHIFPVTESKNVLYCVPSGTTEPKTTSLPNFKPIAFKFTTKIFDIEFPEAFYANRTHNKIVLRFFLFRFLRIHD